MAEKLGCVDYKDHVESLVDNGCVHYLDCGSSFMGV